MGELAGFALGGAFATTLLVFPFVALATQFQKKAKLGWRNGLLYFLLAMALCTVMVFAIYVFSPQSLRSSGKDPIDLIRLFVVPLASSFVVLNFVWKPGRVGQAGDERTGQMEPPESRSQG